MPERSKPRLLPDLPKSKADDVKPLYVCPGMTEVPVPYALFPYGSGCSKPRACPIRDCCLWFAAHDLGGTVSIADFPDEAILPAGFRPFPFYCHQFRSLEQKRRRQRKKAKKSRAVAKKSAPKPPAILP
jgi:hypothetical protein